MRKVLVALTVLCLPLAGAAHVNSPDVYYDGYAGPYHLLVTIRPPAVIPGIADIQIRAAEKDVENIKVLPLKMTGVAAKLAPAPDTAERSDHDPQLFHGKLWIMTRGSWKVQIDAEGRKGAAQLFVPLPAVSSNSATMQKALGALLALLGLALVIGVVGIVGAAAREATLPAGQKPAHAERKRGYRRETVAAVLVVAVVIFGGRWWGAEAAANARLNYNLPHLSAKLQGANLLRLNLDEPQVEEVDRYGVESTDKLVLSDLVPDHGHLMHLFLVQMPGMKSFWHLHPDQLSEGRFALNLPPMPAGHYQIYADIVHRTGFPETQVGSIDLPALAGEPLAGDDAGAPDLTASDNESPLPDGYRMVWDRDASPLRANEPLWFRFRLIDKDGRPATDMENYMGMAGHAVFLSEDGGTFAHVHPAGSVSMAAAMLAAGSSQSVMEHEKMSGAEVSFPYGFPRRGNYRIFVQVKRAGQIETGSFRAHVN